MKVQDKIGQMRACLAAATCELDDGELVRELQRYGSGPRFILAANQNAAKIFWLHLVPNPWGSMRSFLAHVEREMPEASHWLIGFEKEPLELGSRPKVRQILSFFEWGGEEE